MMVERDFSVSVALASYNGGPFIGEQLESLARQTLLPSELVICDDGSTDNTVDVIQEFALTASFPVKLYRNQQTLGHSRNFLKAAKLCQGEWVAFCDQDDYWHTDKFERVGQAVANTPEADMVVHVSRTVDHNLRSKNERLWPRIPERTLDDFATIGATAHAENSGHVQVFRARLLKILDITDSLHDVPHDYWTSLLAYGFGKVLRIPDVLVSHRRHYHALTGSAWRAAPLEGLRSAQRTGGEFYAMHARLTSAFASMLLSVDTRRSGIDPDRLQAAANRFMTFSDAYANRASIHGQPLRRRAHALYRNLRSRAYASVPHGLGFGRRAFVKDVLATVGMW